MHAITHVADFFEGDVFEHVDTQEYFQNYNIYIGNDPDYTKNASCAGGPFLRTDDSSSYHYNDYVGWYPYWVNGAVDNDPFGYGEGMMWPYGAENWCNLEGTHLHLVADLNHLVASGSFTMSICTLGVFGTRYVRDGPSLPASIEIIQGASEKLTVSHIYSELTIGTTLAINMRQGS